MRHRILFGSYPIPRFAGIASHNFVVWTDEKGRPLYEINGGAANADGSFNYCAILGPLTAVVTDYADRDLIYRPEFYTRPTSRTTLLLEGNYASIADRWRAAVDVAEQIRHSGLRYSFLVQNSNSVATAIANSIGVAPPRTAIGRVRAPGSYRRLALDRP
ncbi:hypothetical protein [Phyllobacterium endophyticum]|jgi:hypothetical protein|uniref:Uncharacterized protein n=1 Tax=Phyllobacterium endophyticum TaxID=1149773 RepID=A0A2P7AUB9_9HYPH|nr:hypothetical protein [Phyllobacterium endophyticum]MBB3234264.1 hypothetical protein [Phyllobacterium endophyticum]PSH57806.1 hypothetical protein CU100_08845 [Phyllobacterium endophyticum]TXR51169.1 hypothetical protein FVA77_01520 [Phyllobacterium endophyticum]TYR44008.1 hypothetical protein FY050_02205 [Phyllobacterium endophyticum]